MNSFPWERSMPDRSSHQGLPEDWGHGSHTARGPFSAPGSADGYGAAATGSHRARAADGYGTGPADAFGTAKPDALGARADSYGPGKTDAFGIRQADTYGVPAADTYGAPAAGPFGDADSFGARPADPFGPASTAAFAAVPPEARPDTGRPAAATGGRGPDRGADAQGFLGALFDFGFTSFVTPKVIKVLYMLIVISTVVSALVFTIVVFKASVAYGVLTLFFGDPLFILIVLAIYRIILEFFVVTFRVAEDIRAIRERDGAR
jgi:hypothetical protein